MSSRLLLIMAAACTACGGSPYEGYKEVSEDVHLRYLMLGEGEWLVGDSDSIRLRIRMARLGDESGSYWSTERWYLGRDVRHGAMVPVMRRLHVGDSMSVIATAAQWPWQALSSSSRASSDTAMVRTELALLELRTPAQMRADAARLRVNDPAAYERRLIQAYIAGSNQPWTRWGTSEMHYRITGTALDTNAVRYRETVQLAWEGRRVEDGQVFDSQGMEGDAFPWSYGTPDQLIQGMETAVSLLREGQEGAFVMPSSMAYGSRGIPGALDPHAPVVYQVRLVSVERGT